MPDNLKAKVPEIVSALFIFLFVYVALSKLINHDQFIYALKQSPLPAKFAVPVSWLVPITELIIPLLLFIPASRRQGLLLSAAIMGAFTIYIGYMLIFTPQLPCSCGGIIQQLSWQGHLVFNILFTVLACIAFILSKQPKFFIAINRLEAENPVKKK